MFLQPHKLGQEERDNSDYGSQRHHISPGYPVGLIPDLFIGKGGRHSKTIPSIPRNSPDCQRPSKDEEQDTKRGEDQLAMSHGFRWWRDKAWSLTDGV